MLALRREGERATKYKLVLTGRREDNVNVNFSMKFFKLLQLL